ncbi:unnamed protein product, partial [Polarella glacialis]
DVEPPAKEEDSVLLEAHMRRLLADKESCDVSLAVGEEEIRAHKVVLASRSAYFRALLSSEFRERSQEQLVLEDITMDQLNLLINFIYADEWAVEDVEFALDMVPIADRFSVLDLKRLCERTLICATSVENVARSFALADRYACGRLRGRALLYMTDSANFHLVMKTKAFAELDKGLILEILHSHRTAPAPAPLPSEPLPGNSATMSKAGQSKMRDHRHGRGGGAGSSGSASSGAARTSATAAAASTSDHVRGSAGGRGQSSGSGNGGSSGSRANPGSSIHPPVATAAALADVSDSHSASSIFLDSLAASVAASVADTVIPEPTSGSSSSRSPPFGASSFGTRGSLSGSLFGTSSDRLLGLDVEGLSALGRISGAGVRVDVLDGGLVSRAVPRPVVPAASREVLSPEPRRSRTGSDLGAADPLSELSRVSG